MGQVYLKYDRASGRYYDVDNPVNGADACPIRPLTLPTERLEEPPNESSSLQGEADEEKADRAEPTGASEQTGRQNDVSIREWMDVGGMVM